MNSPQAAVRALVTPPTEPQQVGRARAAPRLADGVELIGEFEDSGFKRAPFIARRGDGQVVQMPKLLYQLAELIDGQSTVDQIAERFALATKRRVRVSDVEMLIDKQLRRLGIVARAAGGESSELNKVDPLLALRFRVAVVPERAVHSLTTAFRPLFLPPVVMLAVLALLGLDGWLFFLHGVSQSLRHVIYQPALMLMLIGGVILATAFHEIGHATACRYGGAKPGVMGVGIYIVWPAFYTDITDAYRLDKRGRLRADTGGMYFNAIFALITGAVYAVTSFEPLLLLIVLQNFTILQQSLPLLRLDGYYILSDLTGVPDIFLRIRSVLASLIPGRPADQRVTELKPWVRAVVSSYVLFIVAFLLVTVVALAINLPRILATGYDSAALRYQAIGPDLSQGQALKALLDLIEMLFLALPAAGLVYTAARIGRRSALAAGRWSSGHPERQMILGLTGATAVAIAAFSWWPNGQYQPVQAREHGKLSGLVSQVAALPSGRPSLTPDRQLQLGGAPTELQRQRPVSAEKTSDRPSSAPAPKDEAKPANHSATRTATSTTTTPTTSPAPTPTTTTPQPTTTQPSTTTTTTTTTTTPTKPPPTTTTAAPTSAPPTTTTTTPTTTPTTTTPTTTTPQTP